MLDYCRRDEGKASAIEKVENLECVLKKSEWRLLPEGFHSQECLVLDSPGSPMVKTLPSNAGDSGSILIGKLRSHRPWGTGKNLKINKNAHFFLIKECHMLL